MSDLFIEVDEALKQERLEKLWKKYGGFLIGFLILIVLATATHAGYNAWIQHRNFKQTNLYLDIVSKQTASPDDLLAILPKVTTGMRTVISLRAAGLALEQNSEEQALSIYQTIESDKAQQKENPDLVSLAKYMATNLDKEMSTTDKISRYETISKEENNPWRYHALLDAAVLEATQNNNHKKANDFLSQITEMNSSAAQGLKQKAQSLNILYQAEQNK